MQGRHDLSYVRRHRRDRVRVTARSTRGPVLGRNLKIVSSKQVVRD